MLKSSSLLGLCLLTLTASPIALAKKPINMDVPAQLSISIDQSVRSTPPIITSPMISADQVITPAQAPTALDGSIESTDAHGSEAPVVDPYAPVPAVSATP